MAFTIRTLSSQAEINLEAILKNGEIKTNTKAIEFVLENYSTTKNALENEKKRTRDLLLKLNEAEIKLFKIMEGFSVITEMIKEEKTKKKQEY